MGRYARRWEAMYREIRKDIFAFCRALNFEPNHHQRMLFTAVQNAHYGLASPRIAVKSGQGTGKTAGSVILGIWRFLQAMDALTIVTAPTMRQCNEVWLAEARRILAKADPMIQKNINVTKTKMEVCGRPDWGVKTVTATKEENAQGFHEKNMTIICEEASGISRAIIEQFMGTASNPNCLFIMIGNPNTRDCAFFDCFNRNRHMWQTMTFNAEETPKSEWFDPIRNKQLEDEFGKDSDVYRIRVLGEFPFSDPNCVMSSEDVEKVIDPKNMLRFINSLRATGRAPAKQIGIDFSRFGGDESTIYRRSGNAIVDWKRFTHVDPSDVVDQAFRMQTEAIWRNSDTWYVADAGGMGQGVMHRFYHADKQIVEFHNNGKAVDQQYDNKITEAWFALAKLIKAEKCYLPRDNTLIQQLTSRRYYTTRKGKLILETKDDYMKRGNESPDRGDGIVLSFYDQVEAVGNVSQKDRSTSRMGVEVSRR